MRNKPQNDFFYKIIFLIEKNRFDLPNKFRKTSQNTLFWEKLLKVKICEGKKIISRKQPKYSIQRCDTGRRPKLNIFSLSFD